MDKKTIEIDVVVLGSGPGGYAAAYRAADLGLKVAMVDRYKRMGGVCANVGCIPSKAMLHMADVLNSLKESEVFGLKTDHDLDHKKLKAWKDGIVSKLTGGLSSMAKMRRVTVVQDTMAFVNSETLEGKNHVIRFKHAVIASGSHAVRLPFLPDHERVFDSTGALDLKWPTEKMLVLGGGIIGCEMATVYNALGAEVHIIEMEDQLMPGADKDLVKPMQKILESRGVTVTLSSKVTEVTAKGDQVTVAWDESGKVKKDVFSQVLYSIGRRPNTQDLALTEAGVDTDKHGFIEVDEYMRSSKANIYAIGDVCGEPMLAHKATAEGRLVAEIIAGKKHRKDFRCIPSVAYTDPEVAWVGLTEHEAKAQGIDYGIGVFPWSASGRSMCVGRTEGKSKILFRKSDQLVLGGGIVGRSAGDLIAELALAIEMGCYIEDISLTIHPHPTLSETIGIACEVAEGSATDLPPQPKRAVANAD